MMLRMLVDHPATEVVELRMEVGRMQDWVHDALWMCAGLMHARSAILQTSCLSWLRGEAFVVDDVKRSCSEEVFGSL